jgi:gamma-glutamylcyclotransferase (GGCT)/AIG2-like uncharacterized protein YtfP
MFPGYQIDAITNGVHSVTWTGKAFKELFDQFIPGWRRDNYMLRYALNIPPEKIWAAHMAQKKELIDFEFFINARGFANVRQKKGKVVRGIIYEISEDDEKELDICEGVQYGTNTKVHSPSINASYYLAKETNEGEPKEGYLERIIEASTVAGFPSDYIDELKSWKK